MLHCFTQKNWHFRTIKIVSHKFKLKKKKKKKKKMDFPKSIFVGKMPKPGLIYFPFPWFYVWRSLEQLSERPFKLRLRSQEKCHEYIKYSTNLVCWRDLSVEFYQIMQEVNLQFFLFCENWRYRGILWPESLFEYYNEWRYVFFNDILYFIIC